MEIETILRCLPHRYPMLLVDRVLECVPGASIKALKNVSVNEPFFVGHFPHYKVMPGVLIIEALAQAAAVLSYKTLDQRPDSSSVYYFVGIDAARFKRPVTPGDQLILDVTLGRQLRGIWKFNATASVEGAVVAEAELMCTLKEIPAVEAP
ncbi:MAG: 3-hydroxyacyl-ACP dehydratase FabZ [Betaproteobacteria bacterium]|nr:3-hydroxyacyl-ACP dehydratase FabZ [Betaproteobacteria bacterium]MBL8534662.1 3-hydroxyacyl-ACP dehydratase FabZ [Betaproteobacteria bacterium]